MRSTSKAALAGRCTDGTEPMAAAEVVPPDSAILVIAHGSRRAEANDDLLKLAELLRSRTSYPIVQPAFLELAEPDIPAGGRQCAERGAKHVLMLPWFLSAGRHVVDDLERYRRQLEAELPGVRFTVCPPLGLHPLMLDVAAARLQEGLASRAISGSSGSGTS